MQYSPIRLGLYGCGQRMQRHIAIDAQQRLTRITASYDLDPARSDAVARQHGAQAVKDYRMSPARSLANSVNIFEGDMNRPAVCRTIAGTDYHGPLTAKVLPDYRHHPEHLWQSVAATLQVLEDDIVRARAMSAGACAHSTRRAIK